MSDGDSAMEVNKAGKGAREGLAGVLGVLLNSHSAVGVILSEGLEGVRCEIPGEGSSGRATASAKVLW